MRKGKQEKYAHIDIENMSCETSSDDIATALSSCAVFYDIKNGDTKREPGIMKELLKLSRKNGSPSYTVIRSRTWSDIYICDNKSEKVFKLCYETFNDTIISVQIFVYNGELFYTQEILQGRTLYDAGLYGAGGKSLNIIDADGYRDFNEVVEKFKSDIA